MELNTTFVILVALSMGITEVFKQTGLKSKYASLSALLIGVMGAMLISGYSSASLIEGLIAGMTASGVWSQVKATLGIVK
mgnify:CR=1 FL=1